MRRIGCLPFVILCGLFLWTGSLGAQTDSPPAFLQSISEVPLMPGLKELPDQSLVFDKPEGRVVEVLALGERIDSESIRRFYAQTLPRLGWKPLPGEAFVREGENLALKISQGEGFSTVRYTLTPR